MAEIIDLDRKREDRHSYWCCSCGCKTFFARNDGVLICGSCGEGAGGGFWRLPDGEPREEGPGDPPSHNTITVEGREFAKRLVIREASEADAAVVVVIWGHGGFRVWGDGEGHGEENWPEWIRRKCREVGELLAKETEA